MYFKDSVAYVTTPGVPMVPALTFVLTFITPAPGLDPWKYHGGESVAGFDASLGSHA